MCLKDARQHANSITNSKFKQAEKVKLCKSFFKEVVECTYLLSQTNEIKDIMAWVGENKDATTDEVIGELQIRLTERWQEMRQTRMGLKTFGKMDVTDVIEGRSVENFIGARGMEMRTL